MQGPRIRREQHSIEKMIYIFCKDNHHSELELCKDCKEMLYYAHLRLERCKFQEDKPVCAKCPIHCYQPAMRSKVIEIMRYSGPRMLYKHPLLAIAHTLDKFRR